MCNTGELVTLIFEKKCELRVTSYALGNEKIGCGLTLKIKKCAFYFVLSKTYTIFANGF